MSLILSFLKKFVSYDYYNNFLRDLSGNFYTLQLNNGLQVINFK